MPSYNSFYTVSQLSRIIEEVHASLEVYQKLWDLKKSHREWDVRHRLLCTFPAGVEREEFHHAQDTCFEINEKINRLKAYILRIRPYWLSDEEISRITEESLKGLEITYIEKLRAVVDLDDIYKRLKIIRNN